MEQLIEPIAQRLGIAQLLAKYPYEVSVIAVRFLPFSSTSPPVGLSSDASMFSSVVLPEPDSPMIATYSPSSTEKFMFEKIPANAEK